MKFFKIIFAKLLAKKLIVLPIAFILVAGGIAFASYSLSQKSKKVAVSPPEQGQVKGEAKENKDKPQEEPQPSGQESKKETKETAYTPSESQQQGEKSPEEQSSQPEEQPKSPEQPAPTPDYSPSPPPTYSEPEPEPDNSWCEANKKFARQIARETFDLELEALRIGYEVELREISNKHQADGTLGSDSYKRDMQQAKVNFENELQRIQEEYYAKLAEIENSC